MKKTMDDLKQAILDVLRSTNDDVDKKVPYARISYSKLLNLQAEYNIHFVEPNEKQVEIV
jgi:hypothetical protein